MDRKFSKSHKSLHNSKSQAALEFLTTYAWAFLVIIIMIAALAYFGILRPSRLLPDRCNFGSEIGCVDFQLSASDDTFDLRLKNAVGEPIVLTAISITSESVSPYSCTGTPTPSLPFTFGSGVVQDFSFSTCTSAAAGFVKGEKGKVDVKITYYAAKSGPAYTHEVNGDVFTGVI